MTGPKQEIIFNPRYIVDGVQTISTIKVALLMNDSSSPAVLRMVEGKNNEEVKNYTYIIMPIKS